MVSSPLEMINLDEMRFHVSLKGLSENLVMQDFTQENRVNGNLSELHIKQRSQLLFRERSGAAALHYFHSNNSKLKQHRNVIESASGESKQEFIMFPAFV